MTDIKETVKEKQKQSTLTIRLTEAELTRLKNEAIRSGFDENWQDYARKRFKEDVTGGLIGQATVGTFKKVTAPTNRYGQ